MFLEPEGILKYLTIPFGGKVGDFGAGAGHFSRAAMSRLSGGGAVYALDAFSGALENMMRDLSRPNTRLYTLQADLNEHIPLKTDLLHAGIAANILHQIGNKQRFAEEVKRVIAPNGEVLVIDWISSFKNMGPVPSAVVTPAEAAALFKQAGFSVGDMLPAGGHHFAFIARNA
jgi:ubiquinone/menaquinone biosynthesis C-methylase UbiE